LFVNQKIDTISSYHSVQFISCSWYIKAKETYANTSEKKHPKKSNKKERDMYIQC